MKVERENKILKYVVEDFIDTATPVPSKRLNEKFHINLSPATIRNVLSRLEKSGLLDHLYTSSGRVPTDTGYRYYVDNLMAPSKKQSLQVQVFMKKLNELSSNVEQILEYTASSLGKISSLFGFAFLVSSSKTALSDLELIRLSSGKILFVLGFNSETVKSIVLDISVEVKVGHLETVLQILRERLLGLTLVEIQSSIGERLKDYNKNPSEIMEDIIQNVEVYFSNKKTTHLTTSKKDYLLDNPEFKNPDYIQSVVTALDNESEFLEAVSFLIGDSERGISIIGKENHNQSFDQCSIVASDFQYGNMKGRLGIIGPTRMQYSIVLSVVEMYSKLLCDLHHEK